MGIHIGSMFLILQEHQLLVKILSFFHLVGMQVIIISPMVLLLLEQDFIKLMVLLQNIVMRVIVEHLHQIQT